MSGPKLTNIGHYEIPRVHLACHPFMGDVAKLQEELKRIEVEFVLGNQNQIQSLQGIYDDLVAATRSVGLNRTNFNDFELKNPKIARRLFRILFRVVDKVAALLETQKALAMLAYFATICHGEGIGYDLTRISELQQTLNKGCSWRDSAKIGWAESHFNKLISGLWDDAAACLGVLACENPTEFHYPLNAKLDEKSGTIILSGQAQGLERLEVDVFCGIEKRESLYLVPNLNDQFVSGPIAQCAKDATMALRWKTTHSKRCRNGIGAQVIPPRVNPAEAIAKRPELDYVGVSQVMVDLVKPEPSAQKFQLTFLVDASGSMKDDIQALKNLLKEIIDILQEQTTEAGELQLGLWHVAGGSRASERDLPLKVRPKEKLSQTLSKMFDQIASGLTGGYEPIWKTLLRIMQEESWDQTAQAYRKIVVLSDEWGNAESNQEPLQVIAMAKAKGIEIKIRGPSAITYELAKLVEEKVISLEDYDRVAFLSSPATLDGTEIHIHEGNFNSLLKNQLDEAQGERLSSLYLANQEGLNLPGLGDKIDLAEAVLDSEDKKRRLQTLQAIVARFQKTSDPEYFDRIAAYFKDEEVVIRKRAVQFFIETKLPNSLRPKYAQELSRPLADANGEIRALAIQALYQTIQEGMATKEKEKYAQVIAQLLKDHKPEVRKAAIQYLGLLDRAKYSDQIVLGLEDQSDRVRKQAVETMGSSGLATQTKYADRIIAKLKDESPLVRQAVRLTIKDFVANHPQEEVRIRATVEIIKTFEKEASSHLALTQLLSTLSEKGKELVSKMASIGLKHPKAEIRLSTLWALETLIANSKEMGPSLVLTGGILERYSDPQLAVRETAFQTLREVILRLRNRIRLEGPFLDQAKAWLPMASLEEKKLAVQALGVLVPTLGVWRYDYAQILAEQVRAPNIFSRALIALGIKEKSNEEYHPIVLAALNNILPTLFGYEVKALPKDVVTELKPSKPEGKPIFALPLPKGVTRESLRVAKVSEPSQPTEVAYNPRDYFEERPSDQPLAINHRFVHYYSQRPLNQAKQDWKILSIQPAVTEESWLCVQGETPAGQEHFCYEVGIAETQESVLSYLESQFTRAIQAEFSKVTELGIHHFHPKYRFDSPGPEYPSPFDFSALLQSALVYQGLGYPEGIYVDRVITTTGAFTMRPNFKEINDRFNNAEDWMKRYIAIFKKFVLEGPELQGLTQTEKSQRFAREVTVAISPYVEMQFEPIEGETK